MTCKDGGNPANNVCVHVRYAILLNMYELGILHTELDIVVSAMTRHKLLRQIFY